MVVARCFMPSTVFVELSNRPIRLLGCLCAALDVPDVPWSSPLGGIKQIAVFGVTHAF